MHTYNVYTNSIGYYQTSLKGVMNKQEIENSYIFYTKLKNVLIANNINFDLEYDRKISWRDIYLKFERGNFEYLKKVKSFKSDFYDPILLTFDIHTLTISKYEISAAELQRFPNLKKIKFIRAPVPLNIQTVNAKIIIIDLVQPEHMKGVPHKFIQALPFV